VFKGTAGCKDEGTDQAVFGRGLEAGKGYALYRESVSFKCTAGDIFVDAIRGLLKAAGS